MKPPPETFAAADARALKRAAEAACRYDLAGAACLTGIPACSTCVAQVGSLAGSAAHERHAQPSTSVGREHREGGKAGRFGSSSCPGLEVSRDPGSRFHY